MTDNQTLCASSSYNLNVPCHGHGTCIGLNEGIPICECFDGWSGKSDWFSLEGRDCQVYEPVVQGLWIFQLCFIILVGLLGWRRMVVLIQRYRITKERLNATGKKYPLSRNRALVSMLVYWAGCWPTHLCLCIVKVYDPTLKIGGNWLPTIFWLLSRSFFYLVGYLFQPSLMRSLLKGKKDAQSYLKSKKVTLPWKVICTSMILCGLLVLIPTIDNSGNIPSITLVMMNSIMFVCLISLGSYAQHLKSHINDILDQSYSIVSDDKILNVKQNLAKIQNEVTRQTFVQMPIFLIFGLWPYLWSKHDYFYPISISVMPIIGFRGIHSLMENSSKNGYKTGSTASTNGRSRSKTNPRSLEEANEGRKGTMDTVVHTQGEIPQLP